MTDTINEEVEYEAKREARRHMLIDAIDDSTPARERYEEARDKHRAAVKAEGKRKIAAEKKLRELDKAKHALHGGWRHSEEARQALVNDYVDPALRAEMERAQNALSKAARALLKSQSHADEQRRIIARKDPKTIEGIKRGRAGKPLPGPPKTPGGEPTKLRGQIPNPQRFSSKEERAYYLEHLEELDLEVQEKVSAAEVLDKAARKAEAAYNAAVEEAMRRG